MQDILYVNEEIRGYLSKGVCYIQKISVNQGLTGKSEESWFSCRSPCTFSSPCVFLLCHGFPRAAHFHGGRLFCKYITVLSFLLPRLILSVSVFRYHLVYKPSSSAPLPCLLRGRPVCVSVVDELSKSFSIRQNKVAPIACAFTNPLIQYLNLCRRSSFRLPNDGVKGKKKHKTSAFLGPLWFWRSSILISPVLCHGKMSAFLAIVYILEQTTN